MSNVRLFIERRDEIFERDQNLSRQRFRLERRLVAVFAEDCLNGSAAVRVEAFELVGDFSGYPMDEI